MPLRNIVVVLIFSAGCGIGAPEDPGRLGGGQDGGAQAKADERPAAGDPGGRDMGVGADRSAPRDSGAATPDDSGAATPDDGGAMTPNDTGAAMPDDTGAAVPAICQQLLASGLPKNPGCDPDVQATGLTAIDSVTEGDTTNWLMISGTKYWTFDQTAGRFNGGGNVAALLRLVAPDCTVRSADNVALNPGCDPDVQLYGLDAIASATTAEGQSSWLLTRGRKFWAYDGTQGAFTGAGADIAAYLRTLPPACTAQTSDGIPLNPGCDAEVQAHGITTIDATTDANGNIGWLLLSGRKYWTFDLATGKFTSGGRSIADFMATLSASCGTTGDGIALNPGCDPAVQVQGPSALSSVTIGGKTSWIILSANRFWSYGEQADGSVGFGGGSDFAAFLRALPVAP